MSCRSGLLGVVRLLFIVLSVGFAAGGLAAAAETAGEEQAAGVEQDVTQGALRITKDDGTVVECPLKHTDVRADVAGFIARVKVTQTFVNPTTEKIEAVYVFPLPPEAAVDDMTMVIGDRRIVGLIKRRAEARQIYEQALLAGQTAALLEQERPNIFTQSVGNIGPGQEVLIEISYVDVLAYDMGTYEFRFPMVVGPRYNPGSSIGSAQPNPPELQGQRLASGGGHGSCSRCVADQSPRSQARSPQRPRHSPVRFTRCGRAGPRPADCEPQGHDPEGRGTPSDGDARSPPIRFPTRTSCCATT